MDKKKQHTVPRCYLENFTDDSGKLFIRRENVVYSGKPSNVLTANLFYTITLENGGATNELEDKFSSLEGHFAHLYRKKLRLKRHLTQADRELLSVFIAAMMLRTKAFRASLSHFLNEISDFVDEIMSMPEDHRKRFSDPSPHGKTYPVEDLLKYREDLSTLHASFFSGQVEPTAHVVYAMIWAFWTAPKSGFFVTSDSPVNWANPELLAEHGHEGMQNLRTLKHRGAELTMPLSKDLLWLGGWQMHFDGFYAPASAQTVQGLNERTVRGAFQEVIAPNKAYLEGLTHGKVKDRPP